MSGMRVALPYAHTHILWACVNCCSESEQIELKANEPYRDVITRLSLVNLFLSSNRCAKNNEMYEWLKDVYFTHVPELGAYYVDAVNLQKHNQITFRQMRVTNKEKVLATVKRAMSKLCVSLSRVCVCCACACVCVLQWRMECFADIAHPWLRLWKK